MTEFWNRKGEPMELMEWALAFEDSENRIVAVDVDSEEDTHVMVSTIWEGMNRPLALRPEERARGIFETAVLVDGQIEDSWRWDTEEEAIEGHDNWCITHLNRHADDGRVRNIIIEREKEAKRARSEGSAD